MPSEAAPSNGSRGSWWEPLPLVLPASLLTWCMVQLAGYIKDDAYISYRYAHHLADGHGMVYNLGEKVEGYTNFLWIVLCAPAFWFGADPVVWSKVLGAGCALGALITTFYASRWLNGGRPSPFNYVAPLLLACSSSVALWAMSGMAPCLMLFAGTAAVYFTWRAVDGERALHFALAGVAMSVAALTRPEGHMFVIVGGLAAGFSVLRHRRLPRNVWWMVGIAGAVLVPYHAWRLLYFGDLLPNTYYVKAAAGTEVYKEGLKELGELLTFNLNWLIGILALFAVFPGKRRGQRLTAVLLSAFFMLYLVKIGRDEMKWHRLFLPVLGLYVVAAGEGMRWLLQLWKGWKPAWMAAIPAIAAAVAIGFPAIELTRSQTRKHSSYVARSMWSFQLMGRHILDNSDPDDVGIFQDAGACAYAAYPLRFVDPIGVVNPFVAHELADIKLNPFLKNAKRRETGGAQQIREFDDRVKEHLFEQNARWVAMVAYPSRGQRKDVRRAFDAAVKLADDEAIEALLSPYLRRNSHHHGMYNDPRFDEEFEFVRVWRRRNDYYLVLFERREDL